MMADPSKSRSVAPWNPQKKKNKQIKRKTRDKGQAMHARTGRGDAALDLVHHHGAHLRVSHRLLNLLEELAQHLVVQLAGDQVRQVLLLRAVEVPLHKRQEGKS